MNHSTTCSFAPPETYGHECGKPATLVGIKPSELTENGIFFVRRCGDCYKIRSSENIGMSYWRRFDPARDINVFK